MRAQDDDLTRPQAEAVYLFLYSEVLRHEDDIKNIDISLENISVKYGFNEEERCKLRRQSLRYVKF